MVYVFDVVVAGHICLDLVPTLEASQTSGDQLFVPGRLFRVGPAKVVLGGCVANTGVALKKLGARVALNAKVGDDQLGSLLLMELQRIDRSIVSGMVTAVGEATSYSIVFSPVGVDRGFLHCPGVNDTFQASDLSWSHIEQTRLLHFGYPPLMRLTYLDGGAALADQFRKAQTHGVLVSLDLAMPADEGSVTTVNWQNWLATVLPWVDIFAPSLDEILQMLRPELAEQLRFTANGFNIAQYISLNQLDELATELLQLGPSIVLIKLGDRGLYLKTSQSISAKLISRSAWQDHNWDTWTDVTFIEPCYDVEIVGTTGAGDCTIAGFLMGLLKGLSPQDTIQMATAVGAFSVQSLDATSNIPAWESVVEQAREMRKTEAG